MSSELYDSDLSDMSTYHSAYEGYFGIMMGRCHDCEEEPADSKCVLCNCWEYNCTATDPWACRTRCECESCAAYRSKYTFPLDARLRNPLTPPTLYDRCTLYELRQFVRNRGLSDPSPRDFGFTHKHRYYRILRAADEKRRFRFLDMAPELRNYVYRDLLVFPRAGALKPTTCYPAILRASKLLKKEGSGILYGENVIQVDITEDHTEDAPIKMALTVHDERFLKTCPHNKFSMIPAGIDAYPKMMRRIQQLHIKIKFICLDSVSDWVHGTSYSFINKCLLTLASFLMEGHQVRKLALEFEVVTTTEDDDQESEDDDQENEDEHGPFVLEDYEIGQMLFPLRRLRDIKQVEITGDLPKKMAKVLRDEMLKSSEVPVHNTLRHWKILTTEAHAKLEVLAHLHGSDCACGMCYEPMQDCMGDMQYALTELADYEAFQGGGGGIKDSVQEGNIRARLAPLQRVLRAAQVAELKKKFAAYVKAEKERRIYDAKAGQGVLTDAEKYWDDVDDIDDPNGYEDGEDDWGFADYTLEDEKDLAR